MVAWALTAAGNYHKTLKSSGWIPKCRWACVWAQYPSACQKRVSLACSTHTNPTVIKISLYTKGYKIRYKLAEVLQMDGLMSKKLIMENLM